MTWTFLCRDVLAGTAGADIAASMAFDTLRTGYCAAKPPGRCIDVTGP